MPPSSQVIVVVSGINDADCRRADAVLQSGRRGQPRPYALRMHCVPQLQNQAVSRNAGVAVAEGDWVAFIDADDVMVASKLSVLRRHLRSQPELQFFLHGWLQDHQQDIGGDTLMRGEALFDADTWHRGDVWLLAPVMHSQAMVRRDVALAVPYRTDDTHFRVEDAAFVRDVIRHIGRSDDAMLFDSTPLTWHLPSEKQRPS